MDNEILTLSEKRHLIMEKMERVDELDTSILVCICGESFEWGGVSETLDQWLTIHGKKCYNI